MSARTSRLVTPPRNCSPETLSVPRSRIALMLAAALLAASEQVEAQMFGPRQLGGFLSRQTPPGSVSNPAEALIHDSGSLTGTERFLRGNRRATDFIGTDMGDDRRFVGVTQARQARTLPAAATVREAVLPEVNRATNEGNAAQRPYPPQLVLDPELSGPTTTDVVSAVERHLSQSPIRWAQPFEVSLVGRTAVLRGAVASERDRELAEALVRFEPGISDVQNDLQIAPLGLRPVTPEPLPAREPESRLLPSN
jgi:hypothetical protein